MKPSQNVAERTMPTEEEYYIENLTTKPEGGWYNDLPDLCRDCLHRGTVKGMDYVKPYCQFYHAVLKKNTLKGNCKYRSTKVGE